MKTKKHKTEPKHPAPREKATFPAIYKAWKNSETVSKEVIEWIIAHDGELPPGITIKKFIERVASFYEFIERVASVYDRAEAPAEPNAAKRNAKRIALLRMQSSMCACRQLWVPGEDAVAALPIETWEHYLFPTREACQRAIDSCGAIAQNWKPMRVLIVAIEESDVLGKPTP